MRKFFVLMVALVALMIVPAFAQEVINPENPPPEVTLPVFDFGTFAGIVAVVSFLVTQGAKYITFIGKNTLTKIATSVVVSIAIVLIVYFVGGDNGFLAGLAIWQVVLQGLLAGLSASGFYDLLKGAGVVKKDG